MRFSESDVPGWLPRVENRRIYQEYFLALEGATVRGAFILKHQDFAFKGDVRSIGNYQLPLSEGIVNDAYNFVGLRLLTNALNKQPLLFSLGMGGYNEPLPRLLKAMGWTMCSVPFFFRVNHPQRFLKNITYLRKSQPRRFAMDVLAGTGLGWAAIKLLQASLKVNKPRAASASVEKAADFSLWADELWRACKDGFSMVAVRDSATLNILYPGDSNRFTRLKVSVDGQLVGWAVVLDTQMSGHKQLGNMRVGSIADCLALPQNASAVVAAAAEFLEAAGVDIVVSNQSHAAWCQAFSNAAFIRGPSNFVFAGSKELARLLQPFGVTRSDIHLNRGDGDGPIHL